MSLLTRSTYILLIGLALFLPGCIKYKQTLTLMPDGSGKIHVSWGLNNQAMQMAKANNQDPFAQFKPQSYKEKCKGIVAFTEPKQVKGEDGFTYMTFNAYFKDINQVSMNMNQDKVDAQGNSSSIGFGAPTKYVYKRDGDGAMLIIEGGLALSLIAERKIPDNQQEKEQMRQMMEGFDLVEQYIMPGTLADSKILQIIDNTAVLHINRNDVIDGTGAIKDTKNNDKIKVVIEDITLSDKEIREFVKELDAAIKAAEHSE